MPLTVQSLVEFLDASDAIGPPEVQPPWPDASTRGMDQYPIDWRQIAGGRRRDRVPSGIEDFEDWRSILSGLGQGAPTGRAQERVLERGADLCAWYQSLHFYGTGFGIFILEDCLIAMATDIARFVPPLPSSVIGPWLANDLIRAAFGVLYLHEAFHHKVESFAVRLHVAEQRPRYRNYWNPVYMPTRTSGPLEEALANADAHRRFMAEEIWGRSVLPEVRTATDRYLRWRYPLDPVGYRDASLYLSAGDFADGLDVLKSVVQEARTAPLAGTGRWQLAPHMSRGLFSLTSDIWILVSSGSAPRIPSWVFPLYRPVSTRELEKALKRFYGYDRVKGGKGSHVRLKAPGLPTLTLAGGRSDLSPPVLRSVQHALGYRDIGEMLSALEL